MSLAKFIESYHPFDDREEAYKKSFLQFLSSFDEKGWASRDNLIGHLTASAWVVNKDRTKVLFAFHNIYNSWAWLGGHADGDLDLLHVAQKEAMEEAGVKTAPVLKTPIDINVIPVNTHIKKGKEIPSHLHYNVVYLLEANEDEDIKHAPDENSGVAWIKNEELLDKVSKESIKKIYKLVMKKVSQL